jgi:hypothetical protein
MKRIEIVPFVSAGHFILNEKRERIISSVEFKYRTTRKETQGKNNFIIDDYEEALAYYNKENEKLFFVLFANMPTYELILNGQNLFELNSGELYKYLNKLDENLHEEDYVGFGSIKYGIDVYAPDFIEDELSAVETISIGIKGYFETIYKGLELDINYLQNYYKE